MKKHSFKKGGDGMQRKSRNQAVSEPEMVYLNFYGAEERSVSFNDHWRFYLGELYGAESACYNDSLWKHVNLPHDYSIDQGYSTAPPAEQESGYVPGGVGWYRKQFRLSENARGRIVSVEFDGVYMNASVYLNGVRLGMHPYGYTPFSFVLPESCLHFGSEENVLAVKVAHRLPSSRWYSGSGIYRDVTLTVTDPVHTAYFGTAVTTPDIANGIGTVTVTVSVKNDSHAAQKISVRQIVYKKGDVNPAAEGEKTDAQTADAGAECKITSSVIVQNPELWSVETPNLYTVRTEVYAGDKLTDVYDSEFGFRWAAFTRDNGFFLNGKNIKLKGVSMHHDQGGLGSEAWRRAVERQVETLRRMGVNAIRVTHNPASRVLIDLCNEKGVLLVEEAFDCWLSGKDGNTEDYGKWFECPIEADNAIVGGTKGETWAEFDLKAMIKRGRNAPSVIMWSLGNEVFQQLIDPGKNGRFPETARQLILWTGQEDNTRYVTYGDNQVKNNIWAENAQVKTALEFANADRYGVPGGLVGFNYGNFEQIRSGHERGWLVYGSETASSINSRGVYDRKNSASDGGRGDRRLTSYDSSCVGWGHTAGDALYITMRQPFNAGEFVWTGFDYIGEPTPDNWQGPGTNGVWPNIAKSSYFGIIDTAGFPKDSFYLYQSQWNPNVHTLHVLPSWNREEIMLDDGGNAEVVVYSSAPVVKLYLNGKETGSAYSAYTHTPTGGYRNYTTGAGCFDFGKAKISLSSSLYATFLVPYEEGKLEAKAYEADGVTPITDTDGRSVVETAKCAAKLTAKADRKAIAADGKDLSYITIDVTDRDGKFVNAAEPEIKVSVEGEGRLLALDNGVQNDVAPHGGSVRKAGKGKLLAIVQSAGHAGSFAVTAKAKGCEPARVTVRTLAEGTAFSEKRISGYTLSRHYYVKEGTNPTLPDAVKVHYADGGSEIKTVIWEEPLKQPDTAYAVWGTVSDLSLRISACVTVIKDAATVLNYAAAIGTAAVLSLPASRPAVTADGTVLSAEFPVAWDIPEHVAEEEGIKEIRGTADLFGESRAATASVRVTSGSYTDGGDAVMNVPEMYINGISGKENAGAAAVLLKLQDGHAPRSEVIWNGRGTLDFRLDTAVDLKNITLRLKDAAPAMDTIKLYVSGDNGADWTRTDCKTECRRADGEAVYVFTPKAIVSETYFRVEFTEEASLMGLEMNTKIPAFSIGKEASLSYLNAGGQIADAADLKRGWLYAADERLCAKEIAAVGKENAAVTVLPKDNEGVIRILLESEDHETRSVYEIFTKENSLKTESDGRDVSDRQNKTSV